ncbi:MAG: hypothetical protein ACREJO_03155 [Phycisphaerales bacterium]
MAHVPSNLSDSDPRRQRAEELLLDRATVGLDAGEHAELELLCAELGLDADDESFDLAAAAFALAATPHERMPAVLREKVAGAARSLSASDGGVSDAERRELKLVGSEPMRIRPQPTRLELVTYKLMAYSGWIAAAASLALATTIYFGRTPTGVPSRDPIAAVGAHSPPPPRTPAELAQATLDRILASESSNTIVAPLTEADGSSGPPAPVGQVVWSGDSNEGVLLLANLPAIDTPGDAYQLWVVDALRDERFPVDAGTFHVEPGTSKGLIQFSAKLPVAYPRAFAITIERAGGNVVSTQSPVVVGTPLPSSTPAATEPGTFAPAATKVAQPLDDEPREEMAPPEP